MNILLLILGCIIAVRLIIPYITLYLLNRTLEKAEVFHGKVKDLSISFVASKMKMKNLSMSKKDRITALDIMNFKCKEVEVDFKWRSLLSKRLDASIKIQNPAIVYYEGVDTSSDVPKTDHEFASSLATALEKFPMLFNVDILVRDGSARYISDSSIAGQDINIECIDVEINHFSNSQSESLRPATVNLKANIYEGQLAYAMELWPLEEYLTFDIRTILQNANLTSLNHLFKTKAKMDFEYGTFGITSRMLSKDGEFKGYIKPVLSNFSVTGMRDRRDSIGNKLWEVCVSIMSRFFQNKENKIITYLPVQGRLDEPNLDIMDALKRGAKSALIHSIWQSLARTASAHSIFHVLFGHKSLASKEDTYLLSK